MPQRNGQNPIRQAKPFDHSANKTGGPSQAHHIGSTGGGICPFCKAEVPPKPGFRFSALKCPKCGKSMGAGR